MAKEKCVGCGKPIDECSCEEEPAEEGEEIEEEEMAEKEI